MDGLHFTHSGTPKAQAAHTELVEQYGQTPLHDADTIVALGGDGFMLSVLQYQLERKREGYRPTPVYGLNYGTLGFLMNRRANETTGELGPALGERIRSAQKVRLTPLRADVSLPDGSTWTRWAFNEVAVRRLGPQAASLKVSVDDKVRIDPLAGDGLLLATPAGSAAYNSSAGGPVLPLSSHAHALTAICPIVPRRWPGAVIANSAVVEVEVLDATKRPVGISADAHEVDNVAHVRIERDQTMDVLVLFDPGHDLDEKLLATQFAN